MAFGTRPKTGAKARVASLFCQQNRVIEVVSSRMVMVRLNKPTQTKGRSAMALHGQELLQVEKGVGLRHEKEADIKDITKVQLKGLGG